MISKKIWTGAAAAVLSITLASGSAFAFCGVIEESATAPTQNMAINKANNNGLRKTRSLDQQYGNVQYDQAQVNCSSVGNGVTCTITQGFCVNPAPPPQTNGDNFNQSNPEPDLTQTPQCRKWWRKCQAGSRKSCTKYETICAND